MGLPPLGEGFLSLGLVMAAALAAGFVDAIVGGGGLIQLPALFASYPAARPTALLGTNKLGSIFGTASAMLRYMRVVQLPWARLLPALGAAFLAALGGASLASRVNPSVFRPLVPVMLTTVLIYVLCNKDIGSKHAPAELSSRSAALAVVGITLIGLYDGFFGPGTGSFLMLLFITLYGFDYLHASAAARTINVATNAGALVYFGIHGEVHWVVGLMLGFCNAVGSVMGAHTAVKHGSRFVRILYIFVVLGLIVKTAITAALKP